MKATMKGAEYCFRELYCSPIYVEAQAVMEGLKPTAQTQTSCFIVFSDCQGLINMLNGLSDPFLEAQSLITEIRSLSQSFDPVFFVC